MKTFKELVPALEHRVWSSLSLEISVIGQLPRVVLYMKLLCWVEGWPRCTFRFSQNGLQWGSQFFKHFLSPQGSKAKELLLVMIRVFFPPDPKRNSIHGLSEWSSVSTFVGLVLINHSRRLLLINTTFLFLTEETHWVHVLYTGLGESCTSLLWPGLAGLSTKNLITV